MTTVITCPANSQLTEADLTTLSLVFSKPLRLPLIELRRILSNRRAFFQNLPVRVVTFDMDAMLHEVALKCSSKIAERLSELVAHGLSLQAISGTPLSIPLTGTE